MLSTDVDSKIFLISSKSDKICYKIFLLPSHHISVWSNRSPRSAGRSSKSASNDLRCLAWEQKLFIIETTGVVTGSNPNKSHAGLWCNRAMEREKFSSFTHRNTACVSQLLWVHPMSQYTSTAAHFLLITDVNTPQCCLQGQQCQSFSFPSLSNTFLMESTSCANMMH